MLIVLTSLGSGGTERSLADLLPRYRAAGLSVELAVFGEVEQGVQEEVTRGGFVVHRVPGRSLATRAGALRRLVRARAPDLVHTSLFDADVAGRVAALGLAPVLTSIVNTSYSAARFRDPRIRPWKLRAAQALDAATGLLLTAHFHAVTETVAREATRTLGIPASRITVVERGRDPARLGEPGPARRAAARSALGIGVDQPVLLNVGREEFQKGQSTLLEAAAALRGRHPDLVVLIAGRRGNVTSELEEQLARLGLEGTVRRLGHRDDVPDLLCAADLFVFPSRFEGIGGAALEAMALGVPVVTTPCMLDVVRPGATGEIVPADDPPALARLIGELLQDPARRVRLAGLAREEFGARFSMAASAERMTALYRRVAAG